MNSRNLRWMLACCVMFVVGCKKQLDVKQDQAPPPATTSKKESAMKERTGAVTFKGNPLTLLGEELKVGQTAPDAVLVGNDLSEVNLSSFAGKVRIICSVPSLDTPVCDLETRRFNEEAAKLGPDVAVLTVSMDLPFAQKRWCGAAGAKNRTTLSDYRGANFASAYGVLIKELHLLARCVFVIDRQGKIAYIQLVREVATEPSYDDVLAAVKKLL